MCKYVSQDVDASWCKLLYRAGGVSDVRSIRWVVEVSIGAAGILLGGLLTYNSKQWLPALQKRLNKEKTA